MIIDRAAPVTGRITLLGRRESCIYLLNHGDEYTILGGGMTYIIPDVLRQLETFSIDESSIRRIIVLHTHFDHMGIVPYLKKRLPGLKICASEHGKAQLSRPEVIESIIGFNRFLLQQKGAGAPDDLSCLSFDGITVDEVFTDGQKISIGDRTLEIMETPGHSSCSLSVYIPEEKALFASDSLGIPFRDKVFTSANSNFDKYEEGLERMEGYDIEVFLAEHYGALVGEEARTFIARSRESARITRKTIEDAYRKHRDVARTAQEVTALFFNGGSGYFLPREVVQMVVGQMVRFIARGMG
jgi:glyoxylase-like metal-dependent hydrolase (beta-lactamase superfamily II)